MGGKVCVLDLACGAGLVRVTVAERLPGHEIHYTGIDNRRDRLPTVEFLVRSSERAAASPAAADGKTALRPDASALQQRLRERFFPVELDLHDARRLAGELARLLGRERYDEIHVHLLHPSTHGRQTNGPEVLRAVAKYLRPGGRLYHLFQTSSPFFDFVPDRLRLRASGKAAPAGPRGDPHAWNEQLFRKGAASAGLVLDKCGHRWDRAGERRRGEGPANNWATRPVAEGAEPDQGVAEIHDRLAAQYSRFSKYATHFVILRKRRRGTARR